jgi:uncharacterized integral membrane protein
MSVKLTFGLVLAGLSVLFAIQNAEPVQFRFLLWSFSLSRALMMFILLAIGVLLGWMMHAVSTYRERRQSRLDSQTRTRGEPGASIR